MKFLIIHSGIVPLFSAGPSESFSYFLSWITHINFPGIQIFIRRKTNWLIFSSKQGHNLKNNCQRVNWFEHEAIPSLFRNVDFKIVDFTSAITLDYRSEMLWLPLQVLSTTLSWKQARKWHFRNSLNFSPSPSSETEQNKII